MATSININEVISDKSSDFNVKKFKLGNLSIDKPLKTIDGKKSNKTHFNDLKSHFDNVLFETSKNVDSNTINTILTSTNDSEIKKKFGYKEWQHEYDNLFLSTFDFNPYTKYPKIEDMRGYFDYYYQFSKTALLIPNINVIKIENILAENKKTIKTEKQIIGLQDYIKYVDEVVDIFSHKNKKQIFVPISLKFNITDIRKLVEYYINKEYFNIWLDFEGATSTDLTKLSKTRSLNERLDHLERDDDVIIYSTNIRREITSNKEKDFSPTSDVLTSLNGSNIIGTNREPKRGGGVALTKEEREDLKIHKSRVFDSDSYYYIKTNTLNYDHEKSSKLLNPSYNILYNTKLINDEFLNQKDEFLKNYNIKEYISNKQMITEYKDGSLKRALFEKGKQKPLDDFFIPL